MKSFGEWVNELVEDGMINLVNQQLKLDLGEEVVESDPDFDPVEYIKSLPYVWNLELLGFHWRVYPHDKDFVSIDIGWGNHLVTEIVPADLNDSIFSVEYVIENAILHLYHEIVAESD